MTVKIQFAQLDQLNDVYEFERAYMVEHEPDQVAKWEAAKDHTLGFLQDHLETMVVAVEGGQVAGYGYWSYHEESPCIFSVYVGPAFRGQGIAPKLLQAMEDQIKDYGHQQVTLSTLETNPAQGLFVRMNYKEVKRQDGWIHYEKQV